MGFLYNLTAIEMLKQLGYTEPIGKDKFILFSQKENIALPQVLFDFLNLATNAPLLSTADIWVKDRPSLRFLYDDIEEMIEDKKEYWVANPDKFFDNEYFQLYKLPKKLWENHVPNYLLIGSDCGAGVVTFGIRVTDLEKSDPPVYMNHEDNSISDWELWTAHLSDFLIQILCDVLSCDNYDTAVQVLEKEGWTSRLLCHEDLLTYGIDTTAMLKQKSLYGVNAMSGYAYNEEKKLLLTVKIDDGDGKAFTGMEYQKKK